MSYLAYYRRAHTIYDVHSPFVYGLVAEVLEDDRRYYALDRLRQSYRDQRALGQARQSPPVGVMQWLFKLLECLQPVHRVQVGIGDGMAAMYQAAADTRLPLHCLSVDSSTRLEVWRHWPELSIVPHHSPDDMPADRIDYLYLHRALDSTDQLQQYERLREHLHEWSCVVVDAPYRDPTVWASFQQQPGVTISVDWYHIGLLFYRTDQRSALHTTLIEWWKKPWRAGFFS